MIDSVLQSKDIRIFQNMNVDFIFEIKGRGDGGDSEKTWSPESILGKAANDHDKVVGSGHACLVSGVVFLRVDAEPDRRDERRNRPHCLQDPVDIEAARHRLLR